MKGGTSVWTSRERVQPVMDASVLFNHPRDIINLMRQELDGTVVIKGGRPPIVSLGTQVVSNGPFIYGMLRDCPKTCVLAPSSFSSPSSAPVSASSSLTPLC
jgi:hypothetical protein